MGNGGYVLIVLLIIAVLIRVFLRMHGCGFVVVVLVVILVGL